MATFDIPGDMQLTPDGSSVVLASGAKRVKQRLKADIETIAGTYKYNLDAGTPWPEWFEQGLRVPIEAELRRKFLSHPEVDSVPLLSLTLDRATRLLRVTYKAQLKSADEITDSLPIAQVATK